MFMTEDRNHGLPGTVQMLIWPYSKRIDSGHRFHHRIDVKPRNLQSEDLWLLTKR